MNHTWNSYIFIQENEFRNVVCEMAAILSQPQCVNKHGHQDSTHNNGCPGDIWPTQRCMYQSVNKIFAGLDSGLLARGDQSIPYTNPQSNTPQTNKWKLFKINMVNHKLLKLLHVVSDAYFVFGRWVFYYLFDLLAPGWKMCILQMSFQKVFQNLYVWILIQEYAIVL